MVFVVWAMNILFIIVFFRFTIAIAQWFHQKVGHNVTTYNKIRNLVPDSVFFKRPEYHEQALTVDKYRRLVAITKLCIGIISCFMYGLIQYMYVNHIYEGIVGAMFIVLACLLLVYLLFDVATDRRIQDKEQRIYDIIPFSTEAGLSKAT